MAKRLLTAKKACPIRASLLVAICLTVAPGMLAAQQGEEDGGAELKKSQLVKIVQSVSTGAKVHTSDLTPSAFSDFLELSSDKPSQGALMISPDGRQLILGRIYQRLEGKLIEITGANSRLLLLAPFTSEDFITFTPQSETLGWVVVFTDVTCPYCKRMHAQMEDYLAHGIEIRYLPFPRYGKGSESWVKTSKAWCADERAEALTLLKKGRDAGRECQQGDALDRFTDVAAQIGVRATPTIILPDGRRLDGMVDAPYLAKILNLPLAQD